MSCIEKIYSVSALVGNGNCNANCSFCAGKYLRNQSAKEAANYLTNLEAAIKLSAKYGGWSLSLTSSGEPTCDPAAMTRVLKIYSRCAQQGAYFPNVNIFTNGILFGNESYCKEHLSYWKELGLTNIALSIHSENEIEQAKVYNINDYPKYETIIQNVQKFGIGTRVTLLLRKGGIDNSTKYVKAVTRLKELGFKNITSWAIVNPDGSRNEFTPSRLDLLSIRAWLLVNTELCHEHSWGGGVFDWNGTLLRLTDYVTKHDPKKDFVRQLVVFQDGTVTYSWIKDGALCMK